MFSRIINNWANYESKWLYIINNSTSESVNDLFILYEDLASAISPTNSLININEYYNLATLFLKHSYDVFIYICIVVTVVSIISIGYVSRRLLSTIKNIIMYSIATTIIIIPIHIVATYIYQVDTGNPFGMYALLLFIITIYKTLNEHNRNNAV